jgi:hypothetical protein
MVLLQAVRQVQSTPAHSFEPVHAGPGDAAQHAMPGVPQLQVAVAPLVTHVPAAHVVPLQHASVG